MSKYIDLDKAITVFDVRGRKHTTTVFQILDKNGAIYETADVVERANANEAEFWKDQYICASEDQEQKHGKWIPIYEDVYDGTPEGCKIQKGFYCSECNEEYQDDTSYCPNCGASMRQQEETE